MNSILRYITATAVLLIAFSLSSRAQFKEEAFSQNYNTGETADTVSAPLFSFKEYARGIMHKDTLKIGTLFAGSTVVIGGQQIYHKQYWKLPIIYGGLGATIGGGLYFRNRDALTSEQFKYAKELNPGLTSPVSDKDRMISTALFAGGALIYWGTLMDGVINYDKGRYPQPGKATLYSVLFPGLGQIYNGEYWKVALYWGCLLGGYHFWSDNRSKFIKYRDIYRMASNPESQYDGPISAENALYYRDVFRRYRDYSVLALAAFYLIQVIDANVFAYMQDFEMSDDISMHIRPAVITPDTQYAFRPATPTGFGLSLGFNF